LIIITSDDCLQIIRFRSASVNRYSCSFLRSYGGKAGSLILCNKFSKFMEAPAKALQICIIINNIIFILHVCTFIRFLFAFLLYTFLHPQPVSHCSFSTTSHSFWIASNISFTQIGQYPVHSSYPTTFGTLSIVK